MDWGALAGILLDGLGNDVADRRCPVWVQVLSPSDEADEFRLCFSDDEQGLLGWTAPPDCQAVGLVATGRLHAPEGPIERPPGLPPDRTDGIRMACLVARDGSVGWRMTVPSGKPLTETPQDGRMLDCLRRCMGLPTPAPEAGAGCVLTLAWLAAIHATSQGRDRRLTWTEVVDLHPLMRTVEAENSVVRIHLAEMIRAGVEVPWTWEDIRQATVRGRWADSIVDADLAAWMDEGMFARWFMNEMAPTEVLLGALRSKLSPATSRRLAHAARAAA